jgi:hypothetical protein
MPDIEPTYVIDWTEDGQGIVLDPSTNPATVVAVHHLPDKQAEVKRLRADVARLRSENDWLHRQVVKPRA